MMIWKDFIKQWRPVSLTRIGIPHRTVYDWKAGTKEPPAGWQRDAAEYWIEAKAGEKISSDAPSWKRKGEST